MSWGFGRISFSYYVKSTDYRYIQKVDKLKIGTNIGV